MVRRAGANGIGGRCEWYRWKVRMVWREGTNVAEGRQEYREGKVRMPRKKGAIGIKVRCEQY